MSYDLFMRNLDIKGKVIDEDKLIRNGFIKRDGKYYFETKLVSGNFLMIVCFGDESYAKLIDIDSNLEYCLVDVVDSSGSFVGKIRDEYEFILNDLISKCFNTFNSKQALMVISYINEKYGDDIEYLWANFPKNGIFRHQDNRKWYALLMSVGKDKFGIDSLDEVDVINLKYPNVSKVVDSVSIFPGYHMNKNHWISVLLDDSLDIKDIYKLIDINL